MLFYRAAVDLPRPTLNYVAGIVRRHRRTIRPRWRLLNPGQQALLVLVHLRKGETFVEAAAGFGVSAATAWRYVKEIVALPNGRLLEGLDVCGSAHGFTAELAGPRFRAWPRW
ncbi:helix-turn-helix domain-containing protein [Actinomadura nitritigenes]|uniref:helix-turn-helix domain-containing protein n=1 Tax=Actinomadura nitritigenes TaxID=134602 RepID=UPI003D8AC5ED